MSTINQLNASYTLKLRRSAATPIYAIALALSFLTDAIGKLAAVIARDP
jgi:hypothetical protein